MKSILTMYSPVWLGPSWAVPGPSGGSLRVLAAADSGPGTQPGKVHSNFGLIKATSCLLNHQRSEVEPWTSWRFVHGTSTPGRQRDSEYCKTARRTET